MSRPLVDAGFFPRQAAGLRGGRRDLSHVSAQAAEDYHYVRKSGMLEALMAEGKLVATEEVDHRRAARCRHRNRMFFCGNERIAVHLQYI